MEFKRCSGILMPISSLPGVALDTAAAEALTANELTLQDSEKHTKAERTAFVDGALAALGAAE